MLRTAPLPGATTGEPRRSVAAKATIALLALTVFVVLIALGVWQLERRAWKHDLIARVDTRVHAAPTAAPGPEAWARLSADDDAYRHVALHGVFDYSRETPVQAVTVLGGGYWILTPLRANGGFTVLVNRGFVPADERAPASRPDEKVRGETAVTGLLRITEPGGGFLRSNDPAGDRWFSRDVALIAAARGLGPVAPYFVDADAGVTQSGAPVGGLTVVTFPDNHLVYALTWFTLAAMLGGAMVWVAREDIRARRT